MCHKVSYLPVVLRYDWCSGLLTDSGDAHSCASTVESTRRGRRDKVRRIRGCGCVCEWEREIG